MAHKSPLIYWHDLPGILPVHRLTRRHMWLVLGITAIAAVMRLSALSVVPFQYDEAALSEHALDVWMAHSVPLIGIPSSVGVPGAPTSVYLMALPFALSTNPLVASGFIVVLNIVGVGLLTFLAQRYLNARIGIVAGLSYALNPWALAYSAKIWEQNLFTPFLLLAFLCGLYGFLEGHTTRAGRWARIVCLPLWLFAVQTHLAAWALLPVYFGLVWLGRRVLRWREMALSLGLAGLTMLPYAIGLFQTYQATPQVFNSLHQNTAITFTDLGAINLAHFATGLDVNSLAGLLAAHEPITNFWIVFGVLAVLGLTALRFKASRPITTLLALWVGLPLAIFSFTWTSVYPHYFVGCLPALSLLLGLGVDGLLWNAPLNRFAKPIRQIGSMAVIALLLTQAVWWFWFVNGIETYPTTGDFNLPLHFLLNVRTALVPFRNVVVVGDDYWSKYNQEPAVWDVLLRNSGTCVRATGSHGFAVFPAVPFAVLISPHAAPHPVDDLYITATPLVFSLRPGEGSYQVAVFDQPPIWNKAALHEIDPVSFDNGATLTGYALQDDQLILEWRLTRTRADDFQYFAHLLNTKGDRIGQQDTNFLPGRSWCSGDRVLTTTALSLPIEATTLRVGMYRLGFGGVRSGLTSSNVIDSAGNAIGQWTDIPLECVMGFRC